MIISTTAGLMSRHIVPPVVVTYATWNPSDKDSDITLSNGDLTATMTGFGGVRSTIGKSSGKWYFEVTVDAVASFFRQVGIGDNAFNLNDEIGNSATGWAYNYTGVKVTNGGGASYGDSWAAADVIGCALDMDSGKVWWRKNGTWQASGDPASGTGAAYTGLSGTIYAAVSAFGGNEFTANFGASAFSHSAPSGFNSGLFS